MYYSIEDIKASVISRKPLCAIALGSFLFLFRNIAFLERSFKMYDPFSTTTKEGRFIMKVFDRIEVHEDANMVEEMIRASQIPATSNEPERIFIHGCNCHGVMGSGIARQIRVAFPQVHDAYRDFITEHMGAARDFNPSMSFDDARRTLLGKVNFVKVSAKVYVGNCFTQFNYGRRRGHRYLEMAALEECLDHVRYHPAARNGVHFPSIGAGLAGGDWSEIIKLIHESFPQKYPLHHYIYQLPTRSEIDI